jgi:predicted N-acyltransferase
MSCEQPAKVAVMARIADIDAAAWDACANPDPARFDPFLSHAFLAALEDAGTVGAGTGWTPRHLVLQDADGKVGGVAPAYLKSHSQGEYVFDHAWADAYHRAGGRYYPKLLAAVPFTPVPGRRLLVPAGPDAEDRERLLAAAAVEVARRSALSSLHVNFTTPQQAERLGRMGFLLRTDQQFHWSNAGYGSFDDFLASLSSRHRKAVRKERAAATANGITIEWRQGEDITEADWDDFFAFYMDTGNRKWGRPYLNRTFFSLLGERLAAHCLLIVARRAGRAIAGALNLIGGDCLYGRYWGAIEHHPCLHFEVCYHQAIEFAIARKLARVEAGAQGDHKLARGYLPVTTWSAHWIADPSLRRAVARYLEEERRVVADTGAALAALGPYRRDGGAGSGESA